MKTCPNAYYNFKKDNKAGYRLHPFRYRGYFYDEETGWYYLKSRYYDPEVGRFLNEDVFYYDGHGIKGYNMYGYCGNNPLNNADSFGTCYYNLNGVMSTKTQYYNLNGVMQVICENQYCSVNGTDYVLNKDNAYVKDWLNYEKNNSDESKVLESSYFSSYKDTFVVKVPIGGTAFSYGAIFLGNGITKVQTVKHEYGHRVQLDKMGLWDYTITVAIPSVTFYILDCKGVTEKWGLSYYGAPWEKEADELGGVVRNKYNEPWPAWTYHIYDILKVI